MTMVSPPRDCKRLGKARRKRRYRSLTELLKECESLKRPCLNLHVSLQSMLQDSCLAFSVPEQAVGGAEGEAKSEAEVEAEAETDTEVEAEAKADPEAEAYVKAEVEAYEEGEAQAYAEAEAEGQAEEEEGAVEVESESAAEATSYANAGAGEGAETDAGAGGQLVPLPTDISVTVSQVITAFLSKLTQQLVRAPAPPQFGARVPFSCWGKKAAATVDCIQANMKGLRRVAGSGGIVLTRVRPRTAVLLLVTFQQGGGHGLTTTATVDDLPARALTALNIFGAAKSVDVRLRTLGASTLGTQCIASRRDMDSSAALPQSTGIIQVNCNQHEPEDGTLAMACNNFSQEEIKFSVDDDDVNIGRNTSCPPLVLQPGKRMLQSDEESCALPKRARCEADDEAAAPDFGPVRLGLHSGRARHYAQPVVEHSLELVAEQEQAAALLPADEAAVKAPVVKSILKAAGGCKSPCACVECEGVRVRAQQAANFSQRQMQLMEDLAGRLMKELRTLRYVVDEHTAAHDIKLKEASNSAVRVEHMARRCLQRMVKDYHRHCRPASSSQRGDGETKPKRRLTFADDAGQPLCQVKLFHCMQQSHTQNNTN